MWNYFIIFKKCERYEYPDLSFMPLFFGPMVKTQMKKQVLLFLVLSWVLCGHSQNNYKDKVYLLPSHLLINDYILGYEYSYSNTKSIVLEAGLGTNPIFIKSVFNLLYDKKIILRLGNKFYISKPLKITQVYLEPIISFINTSYKEKTVNGVILNNMPPQYTLLQSVNATSYCIDFVYGREFFYKPQFSIDYYLGAGVRYRISNKIIQSRNPAPIIPTNETYPIESKKNEFIPSIVLGVKFSYSFVKIN